MRKYGYYLGLIVALGVWSGPQSLLAQSQERRIDPIPFSPSTTSSPSYAPSTQSYPEGAVSPSAETLPLEPKKLYFSSTDFPPNVLFQYPARPEDETQFWQLLDKELSGTRHLSLTNNIEDADYRVELRCAGVFNCPELSVDIKDPNRNLLGSFSLKHFAHFGGLGGPNLLQVAHDLAQTLDNRIQHFPQGNYGYTK